MDKIKVKAEIQEMKQPATKPSKQAANIMPRNARMIFNTIFITTKFEAKIRKKEPAEKKAHFFSRNLK